MDMDMEICGHFCTSLVCGGFSFLFLFFLSFWAFVSAETEKATLGRGEEMC